MGVNDRPFLAGVPWGISRSDQTWPGLSPHERIFNESGMANWPFIPLRYESEIETLPSTRVLPNGVRIDKFQGYRAPVPTAEETWRWAVKVNPSYALGHSISGDYGGYDLATRYMHGMIVGIYVLEILTHPSTYAQRWTAQARWEGLRVENEPGFMAGYAIYTARFVRLTEWNFILGPVTIS